MDNQLETIVKTEPAQETPASETMSHAMASHEDYEKSFRQIKTGEYVVGKVVKIEDSGVFVDIGYKQEGFIPLNQLSHKDISNPAEEVSIGQEVPVVVLKCNDMEGELILSKKRADLETAWRQVTKSFEDGEVVTATVVEAVKGGLLVDLGLRGFVPASQVDTRPIKDLSELVGEAFRLRVIELDRSRRKVVLSRKKVLEEERSKAKEETMGGLYEGQIIKGAIARLTDFGAFVGLGGVDGLVHISEIAWKRIKHPGECLKVGQTVDVMVLKVDRKKERISLSIRQALPDPWLTLDKKFSLKDIIKGVITKVAKKYVFVEVMDGVEGVIPMHELSDKKFFKPEEVVKEGQEVEVKVLEIDQSARRMLLSLRQAHTEANLGDVAEFTSEKSGGGNGASIGDILKAKMREMEHKAAAESSANGEKMAPAKSAEPPAAPAKAVEPPAAPVRVEAPVIVKKEEAPLPVEAAAPAAAPPVVAVPAVSIKEVSRTGEKDEESAKAPEPEPVAKEREIPANPYAISLSDGE
jgi:ribosomal protein S1